MNPTDPSQLSHHPYPFDQAPSTDSILPGDDLSGGVNLPQLDVLSPGGIN